MSSILLLLSLACISEDTIYSRKPHVIPLRLGYKVAVGAPDGDMPGYHRLALNWNDQIVFLDTTGSWLGKYGFYPLVLHFGSDHDEVLLKTDERPNKEGVVRLFIRNGKVYHQDTLPSFDLGARDLGGDGLPRFCGVWDYRQTWTDASGEHACYEPIIYYKLVSQGLLLDTALTRSINQRIYGKFYGYAISEERSFPAKRIDHALGKEWDRIKHARRLTIHGY